MSTHLVGEEYTLLHRNSYEMTPRWGVIPVRNDTPLGGCNDTPSGGCKKIFSRFARIFLLHPPRNLSTPPVFKILEITLGSVLASLLSVKLYWLLAFP